jgi:hypothetical protein
LETALLWTKLHLLRHQLLQLLHISHSNHLVRYDSIHTSIRPNSSAIAILLEIHRALEAMDLGPPGISEREAAHYLTLSNTNILYRQLVSLCWLRILAASLALTTLPNLNEAFDSNSFLEPTPYAFEPAHYYYCVTAGNIV